MPKMIKTLDGFAKEALKFLLAGLPPMALELSFDGVNYHTAKGAKAAAKIIHKQRDKKEINAWLKFIKKHNLVDGFKYLYKELGGE